MGHNDAETELRSGSSWASVRSGLTLFLRVWSVLTVLSVAAQLASTNIVQRARADDEAATVAGAVLATISAGYQVVYLLLALALLVAALRLTRAPPETRVIPPALAAAAAWLFVALLNLVVLVSGSAATQVHAERLRVFWILLAASRLVGVFGLLFALLAVARAGGARIVPAAAGGAVALAAVDTALPLWRQFSQGELAIEAAHPWVYRAVLLGAQVLLAGLLVDLAIRARRAIEPLASRPVEALAVDEPEPSEPEPSEPEPSEREGSAAAPLPPSPVERAIAAPLVALAVAALPFWDALRGTASLSALSDALAGAPGTEFPTLAVVLALVGVTLGLGLHRLMASAPFSARGLFALAALGAGWYALGSARELAVARSHEVDAWPVCETGQGIGGETAAAAFPRATRVDGPRLDTGQPCTLAAERRDEHFAEEPRGGVQDGAIQIANRFADDRARFFGGTLGVALALIASGVMVARAARQSAHPARGCAAR